MPELAWLDQYSSSISSNEKRASSYKNHYYPSSSHLHSQNSPSHLQIQDAENCLPLLAEQYRLYAANSTDNIKGHPYDKYTKLLRLPHQKQQVMELMNLLHSQTCLSWSFPLWIRVIEQWNLYVLQAIFHTPIQNNYDNVNHTNLLACLLLCPARRITETIFWTILKEHWNSHSNYSIPIFGSRLCTCIEKGQ